MREFKSIVQATSKVGKSGRSNTGGLALLYKNKFHNWMSIEKSSSNFLWFRINKFCANNVKDIVTDSRVSAVY